MLSGNLLFINLQKVFFNDMQKSFDQHLWSGSNAQRCGKSKFTFDQVLIKCFSCLELRPCETCKNPVFFFALMDMSWVVVVSTLLGSKFLILAYLMHTVGMRKWTVLIWCESIPYFLAGSFGGFQLFQMFSICSLVLFLIKACVICYLLFSNR